MQLALDLRAVLQHDEHDLAVLWEKIDVNHETDDTQRVRRDVGASLTVCESLPHVRGCSI